MATSRKKRALATKPKQSPSTSRQGAHVRSFTEDDLRAAVWRFAQLATAYSQGPLARSASVTWFEKQAEKLLAEARRERERNVGIVIAKQVERVFKRAMDGELEWSALRRATWEALLAWSGSATEDEVTAILSVNTHGRTETAIREEMTRVQAKQPVTDKDARAMAEFRLGVRDNDGPKVAARKAVFRVLGTLADTQASKVVAHAPEGVAFAFEALGRSVSVEDVAQFVFKMREVEAWAVLERGILPPE